jgi:hypothetical protein
MPTFPDTAKIIINTIDSVKTVLPVAVDSVRNHLTDTIVLQTDSSGMVIKNLLPAVSAWEKLYPSLIPIVIAFLAAFVALQQAKMNIIAGSRIRWIENLRIVMAEYVTSISKYMQLQLDIKFNKKS